MKQTNNAIKFLMAQYRAIFKNANIAMVAAIAAAALASGQAQAAKAFDRTALEGLTSDTIVNASGEADPQDANTYTNLTLEVANKANDIAITKAHTFNITGGKEASGSSFDSKKADVTAVIDLSNSTLNLQAGESTAAADAVLKVGASNAVDVKLGTLNVTKGTLEVVKGSISATNITIGKAEAKATQAIVNVSGTVGAAGNTVKIIDGGLVESKAEGAKLLGNVTVSGGEIKSAGSSDLTITESLNVQSGKLNIAGGKVTLENGGTFADKSIVHSGTLVVKGATPVQLTGKFSGAAADAAVLELTDGAVSMDMDTLKTITTGKATLAVTAKKAGTLVLQGDKVDLADGKVILSESGEKTDKINLNTDGTLTIKTTEATFGAADTINAKLAFEVDTLTAGKADGTKFDIKGGTTIKVSKALNVQAADATKAALNVISGTVVLNGTNGTKGTLTASAVNLNGAAKADAKFNITGGDWSVADLAVTSGDVSIVNGASLAVTGTMTTAEAANGVVTVNASKIDAAGAKGLTLKAGGIKLENTATLTLDKSDFVDSNGEIEAGKFASGSVVGEANTTITIMDGNKKMQFANGDAYKKFYDSTGFKGTLDVDVTMDAQSGSKPIDQILSGLNNDEIYKNVTATTADGNVSGNKSAGKVEVSANKDLTLGADTALMLNGAQGGNFVSKTDASGNKVIADVTFGNSGNSLTLKGDGKLGAVAVGASATGSLTIGTHDVASNTTVVAGKDLGADSAALTKIELNNAGSSLTVESGSVYATTLNVNEGADLIVKAGKVVSENGTIKAGASLTVSGDVTYKKATVDGALKANTLTLSGSGTASTTIEHNFASADVDVTKLVLGQHNQLNIGQDNVDKPEQSKTGSVYAGNLELNQGKAFIDPSNAVGYSFLAVNNLKLKSGALTNDKVAGELNGTVTVGKNAVFGVGFESDQALVDMLAKYTDPKTGALKDFSSALVLNKQVTLAKNTDGITVNPNANSGSATAGTVEFTAGSGLVITDEVYGIDAQGNKSGSAITFTGGTVTLDPTSKLVLIGDFSGADKAFQVFSGAGTITGSMKIESANGLLTGTLNSGNGTVGLDFSREKAEELGAFSDASAPVRELLFGKLSGDVKGKGLGFDLISDVATGSLSGVVADAAAHAATYAGAQQAAVVSVTTMADAMFGRVGAVGVEAASIAATGSQANGGVWLTPMYKSMDSDGFNAEGVSYGSDVDAAGVAFGADTVNGNMRFGAVFNIGSGDAEGKGNGNGLKDEFDYYGFGIYSAMGFGNFALVGDASMTVISHDVEGLGLKGKADTTAVTMGVTGQYTVATPAVDVTPHLGARFIRLNTDSYDLVGDKGVVATTDFDVQNVFSVPLGVTLSKGFVAGGWTLAPSADLTVTFNTGDTEAKSTTTFTGTPAIGLNTEVLDEVQYGVTLGLGAQNGAFGTSFGINYTGSSNTDSFGVNAQCRYMF
ncbi:MAG: hypothetical protein Q4A68_08820 [Anaerobiospirillum succiniciproducens]|uniref:beta strand repeat-containing protein n=1 Tax=Anaerobiospirillum succiniciproducens TaxID=13335 RepID=UPI0026DA7482|nr:autotransporter domain-containing protein [Anaerobiospirillum succiniciproducens]MDO4676653.1 hypothetical protein [Anaerobiospirillum succiniciproducens]